MLDKKYRPKTFKTFIGNREIVNSLKSLVNHPEKFPSTVLLQGESGCGKTTLARIIAKNLDVDSANIFELNIGNARGIDNARAIIENLRYSPLTGGGKVIVLNEAHGATKSFQDAMLEVLEEPPPKTHFILCTTNPEKLLDTIKTRSTIFTVKKLGSQNIKKILRKVIRKEELKIDENTLRRITTAANGTPRTALVILNAVSYVESSSERKKLIDEFFYEGDPNTNELCQILLYGKKPYSQAMAVVAKIEGNPEDTRLHVLNYMSKVLQGSDNPRAAMILENFYEPFWNVGKAGLVFAVYGCYHYDDLD